MNDFMRDMTAIATAVIGLAVITVVLRSGTNTSAVIKSASGGFSSVLGTAMGGTNLMANYGG